MQSPIDSIRERKTGAKNQRDRGVRGYPRALQMLDEAIVLARQALDGAGEAEARTQAATELSDCFGLLGGVERRWADDSTGDERMAHLRRAARAYDEGFAYESDAQYGMADSYNRVNRLLVRLLLAPGSLTGSAAPDADIAPLDLAAELEAAASTVRRQLAGPRRGDYWALADLALLDLLGGRGPAAAAYAGFLRAGPPAFAFASVLAGLQALAALPLPVAPALAEAVTLLEGALQRLRA